MKRNRNKPPLAVSSIAFVAISLAFALVLSAVIIPGELSYARPDFVALTLIYLCWTRPEYVGFGVAFLVGIVADVMHFSLLGENVISNVAMVYLAMLFARHIGILALPIRILAVFFLLAVDTAIASLIQVNLHEAAVPLTLWLSPFFGTLLLAPFAALSSRLSHG